MNRIHSARDSLTSQLFEDFDSLAGRIEALQATAVEIDRQLKATAAAINEGSDRFRMTVTAFVEDTKAELKEDAQRNRVMLMAESTDDFQASMQKIARAAFQAQSWDTASTLADRLRESAAEFRRSIWSRMFENSVVAFLAGLLASALTYGLVTR